MSALGHVRPPAIALADRRRIQRERGAGHLVHFRRLLGELTFVVTIFMAMLAVLAWESAVLMRAPAARGAGPSRSAFGSLRLSHGSVLRSF